MDNDPPPGDTQVLEPGAGAPPPSDPPLSGGALAPDSTPPAADGVASPPQDASSTPAPANSSAPGGGSAQDVAPPSGGDGQDGATGSTPQLTDEHYGWLKRLHGKDVRETMQGGGDGTAAVTSAADGTGAVGDGGMTGITPDGAGYSAPGTAPNASEVPKAAQDDGTADSDSKSDTGAGGAPGQPGDKGGAEGSSGVDPEDLKKIGQGATAIGQFLAQALELHRKAEAEFPVDEVVLFGLACNDLRKCFSTHLAAFSEFAEATSETVYGPLIGGLAFAAEMALNVDFR